MKKNTSIPISLITGYLGSGKTTFLNNILKNAKNHKIAVIVNDIGEVNIDEELIEKGGIVSSKDDNLIPLQNGCICCTLKEDLIKQLADLVNANKFDYIIIEASGICEPIPIAQSIVYMQEVFKEQKLEEFYYLDSIIAVVDALRMRDEFGCGDELKKKKIDDEDIENLIIQQIEFCDVILLNKTNEVKKEELARIKATIRSLQKDALIIECNYCDVDIDNIISKRLFSYEKTLTSSAWIKEFEKDEDEHEHEHHHGSTANEDESHEEEEYGISSFVYTRRKPFDKEKFEKWQQKDYKRKIIRTKGMCYFKDDSDNVYLYEQAGRMKKTTLYGKWASADLSEKEINKLLEEDEEFRKLWDDVYMDRLIKLVFIGQKMDKKKIIKELDSI